MYNHYVFAVAVLTLYQNIMSMPLTFLTYNEYTSHFVDAIGILHRIDTICIWNYVDTVDSLTYK